MNTINPTWQQKIITLLKQRKEQTIVVIDPDNLLSDEVLLADIQSNNFDVLRFDNEVVFRNLMERNYRDQSISDKQRHLIVIFHSKDENYYIPYDLIQKSRRIEVGVSLLFPNLNALAVKGLDKAYYQDLYGAHETLVAKKDTLWSERQTVEFILRVVFGIEPAGVISPTRVAEMLIDIHHRGRTIPAALQAYLFDDLAKKVTLYGFTPEFFVSPEIFYGWLGDQWGSYIKYRAGLSGPSYINFEEFRPKAILTNLFADGKVMKVDTTGSLTVAESWIAAGIIIPSPSEKESSEQGQKVITLKKHIEYFSQLSDEALPSGKNDFRAWLNLAAEWAEVIYQANTSPNKDYNELQNEFSKARAKINEGFLNFVKTRYSAVSYYQDNKGPISVAGVNSWLYQNVDLEQRLALVCFDGLALDQWYLLREFLLAQNKNLKFNENRTFALAPSITSISRQALFSGRNPDAFAGTWNTTTNDPNGWQAYWVNKDIISRRVAFKSVKIGDIEFPELGEIVDSKNKRLAILINFFDEEAHKAEGMPFTADKRVLYNTLLGYLSISHLGSLFELLLRNNYRVFITADHGNICGVGNGIALPKTFIETYAKRVAIFDKEVLAKEFAEKNKLLYFRSKNLPNDLHPVYPLGTDLYAKTGNVEISHGGLSLEELIVPFVEVTQQ